MARKRYIRTNSNYVLKDIHQNTNIGNIYERNWMTIESLNTYAPGSIPSYGLNGFKMIVQDGVSNLRKRHQYGSWLKNDDSEYWAMSNIIDDENILQSSNEVILKPSYFSITDFVYFGSAEKMIESSILNIINDFPGEIFLREEKITIDGYTRYYVDNPFDIEFDTILYNEEDLLVNPLRIFSKSYEDYLFYDKDGYNDKVTWSRNIMNNDPCIDNGNLLSIIDLGAPLNSDINLYLYYYNINGEKVLFHDGKYTGGSIRPNNKIINQFFQNLNDFEKNILNKKTNYTVYIDTPEEDENGWNIITRKSHTWPKSPYGKWNIDTRGEVFKEYVTNLSNIGTFYDRDHTNNLWSRMTHESIANFDETILKISYDNIDGELRKSANRMKSFIYVAGRNFDYIKRYIDGISFVNTVTYDESNNNPDCFLTDSLFNSGWDVKSPIPLKYNKYITGPLYDGHMDGYSSQEAIYEFYRRLLLNTRAIMSAKGTKRGIEMVMSLFGYRSLNFVEHSYHDVERDGKDTMLPWSQLNDKEKNDILRNVYDITEYVYVTDIESPIYQEGAIDSVKEINSLKIYYNENDKDVYQGLPVKEVLVTVIEEPEIIELSSGEQITSGYKTVDKKYLIPWFDKNKTYDNPLYFESKGGWGLSSGKKSYIPEYGEKFSQTNSLCKVYDETIKYLKFAENISELINSFGNRFNGDDVYYVYDIGDIENYDGGYKSNQSTPTMSHYFILKHEEYHTKLGVVRDIDGEILTDNNGEMIYGWKNISEEELKSNTTSDAQKVFYLEGIIENNLGNNPHAGFGNYDDGETFKTAFEKLFKPAYEQDAFPDIEEVIDILNINNETEIEDFSFEEDWFILNKHIDNIKTWYFTDLTQEQNIFKLKTEDSSIYELDGQEIPIVGDTEISVRNYTDDREEITSESLSYTENIFNSKQYPTMLPVNMEDLEYGEPEDEAAANSIINSKSLYIEFMADYKSPLSMYDFINEIVMHYVKQVIPSTTLFKYKIPITGWDTFCYKSTYLQTALI